MENLIEDKNKVKISEEKNNIVQQPMFTNPSSNHTKTQIIDDN